MIDAVVGAAVGYSADEMRPFLKSLRETGYDGQIVMFANKGAADECGNWGVDLRKPPQFRGKPHGARFLWIEEAVRNLSCSGVLLADTRDVLFQKNPRDLSSTGFHAYEEDRSMTIGSCPYNSDWILTGYGEQVLNQLRHVPISCVGTSCGDIDSVRHYLSLLRAELERIQPRTSKPQDQAAHNFLIRKRVPTTIWNNEVGEIYTVGYLPRNSVAMESGLIVNQSAKLPVEIHIHQITFWDSPSIDNLPQ